MAACAHHGAVLLVDFALVGIGNAADAAPVHVLVGGNAHIALQVDHADLVVLHEKGKLVLLGKLGRLGFVVVRQALLYLDVCAGGHRPARLGRSRSVRGRSGHGSAGALGAHHFHGITLRFALATGGEAQHQGRGKAQGKDLFHGLRPPFLRNIICGICHGC